MPRKRTTTITEEQVERIVELRLNRVPVRRVAEEVGCNKDTVTKHWRRYLDGLTEERTQRLAEKQSEMLARLDHIAAISRMSAVRAANDPNLSPEERHRAAARFLSQERQTLRDLARVAGFEAPIRVAATLANQMSEEEADRILSEMGL